MKLFTTGPTTFPEPTPLESLLRRSIQLRKEQTVATENGTLTVEEQDEESGRAMPDDLKTIGAIIRLLRKHEDDEAADIMEYVSRRFKRLAMIKETADRR